LHFLLFLAFAPFLDDSTVTNRPFQISLREVFRVTSIVSLVLGLLVIGLNRKLLNSLGWAGIPLALCPIAVIWAIDHWRLVTALAMTTNSLVLFALAMPIYAIRVDTLGEVDALLGFVAFALSFLFAVTIVDAAEMTAKDFFQLLPAIMGATANAAFVIGFSATLLSAKDRILSRALAKYGTAMSLALLVPLSQSDGFKTIYPGYGLWVSSLLALWLGTRRAEPTQIRSSPAPSNSSPLGSIARQSESAPIEFRKVELRELSE